MKLVPLTSITVLSTILGLTGIASAQRIDVEAFNQELAALERSLVHPAPGPGLDRASGGPPRWCPGGQVKDIKWPGEVASNLEQYRANHSVLLQPLLVSAAAAVCTYNAPGYQRAATEILQYWINETGLSEADAVASLAARIDPDAWQAEHDQLCHAVGSGNSRDNEQSAMAEARDWLFGCDGTSHSIGVGWMTVPSQGFFNLYPFLDRGAMERNRDEIVRLAYLSSEINLMLNPREQDHPALARYAVVQYDIHELAPAQAVRQLDAAPYRGNRFARTVVVETIAHTKLTIPRVEAEVAKRTKDRRWKDFLITIPQAAASAWLASADRHRDVLARSDALAEAIAAHDEAAHGCEAKLRADLAPIVAPLAKGASEGVEFRLARDPLLGLLVSRLAACTAFEGERDVSRALGALAGSIGGVNGPRAAAYDAVAFAARRRAEDRRHSRSVPRKDRHPEEEADDDDESDGDEAPFDIHYLMSQVGPPSGHGYAGTRGFGGGVIQSVTPVGKRGAVKLTFVTEHFQYMSRECWETNKVDQVLANGKRVYRVACRDTGMKWGQKTPSPVTVPASCTAGLAKGHMVGLDHDLPVQVFTDKTGKHLLALGCLALT